MINMRFSILDMTYQLVTDERQYILYRVVESKAKDAVDGLKQIDPKYFHELDHVWAYVGRTAPIATSKVLSSLEDLNALVGQAGAAIGILRDTVKG